MKPWPNQSNRRWRCQFRYRGSRRESAVALLFSLIWRSRVMDAILEIECRIALTEQLQRKTAALVSALHGVIGADSSRIIVGIG